MKKTLFLLVAVALLACIGPSIADEKTERATTLEGEYVWSQRDNRGDLRAIFTAAGEGKWDVSFHFDFRDKPHVYSGTAEGSLSEGKLAGTVKNEDKRRTFTFSGSFAEGKFDGTHAEVVDGEPDKTGTLWLK